MSVILNEVKNLVESMGWKTEILRLMPQNDIATQSPPGGGKGSPQTRLGRDVRMIERSSACKAGLLNQKMLQ